MTGPKAGGGDDTSHMPASFDSKKKKFNTYIIIITYTFTCKDAKKKKEYQKINQVKFKEVAKNCVVYKLSALGVTRTSRDQIGSLAQKGWQKKNFKKSQPNLPRAFQ